MFERMDYQQKGQFLKFTLGLFLLDYQEQIMLVLGYCSSALLEASSTLVVISSHKNNIELWEIILL